MKNIKQNVFEYLKWRGDLSFEHSSFNEVDSLVFSIFSYLDFSFLNPQNAVSIKDVDAQLMSLPVEQRYKGPGFIMRAAVSLFQKAAQSERFGNIDLVGNVDIIDEEKEMQFAAITFLLPDHTGVISFRGTDTSLIGWKEDLNMSFISGIPSQLEAAKYAVDIMEKYSIPFILTGHSKGGNLAVWAAAHLSETQKERLLAVYSNDGPGFNDGFLDSDNYKEIRVKIHTYVPESSIVGVLMSQDDFITISSSGASLLQHDPFLWNAQGDKFIYSDSRTLSSRQMELVINSWIKAMSPEEREALVESLFDLLQSSDAKTLEDLDKKKLKSLFSMSKTFREMGVKKQAQLLFSLSKVVFNRNLFSGSYNLFRNNQTPLIDSKSAE